MPLAKGSRMLNYINARMRVTILDSRVLVGTFMAFDKHMNIVLGDTEEYRKVKSRNAAGKTTEQEMKRFLGLVLIRGENVVSLQLESMPTQRQSTAPAGVGSAKAVGRGAAVVTAAAPVGLSGPVRGVGGPAPAMMAPPGYPSVPPGMPPGMPMPPPGFPGAPMPLN